MKRRILLTFMVLWAVSFVAQAQNASQLHGAAQLRRTTVTTIDTVLMAANPTNAINDSIFNARFDDLGNQLKERLDRINGNVKDEVLRVVSRYNDYGQYGNFAIAALKNMFPIMPFIALIFIAYYWFRYVYRRRLMRQDMMNKYIDRGETVPDWLAWGEHFTPAKTIVRTVGERQNFDSYPDQNVVSENHVTETSVAKSRNATLFLIISIIMAVATFIWCIVLVNVRGGQETIFSFLALAMFAAATFFSFREYLKRTE